MALNEKEVAERLSQDARFFIETFFYIVDKDRNRVPFLFNPPQAKYWEHRTHNDLILKARKEGFSSVIEAIWLHACIFGQNVRAVTLSHELESTMRHFERVRYYLNNMGVGDMKLEIETDRENQRQITFPATNSSYWIGTAGSKAFGRGDDITHLHLSEVAHYADQTVLTGVIEACVPGAYKVMETTANGVGEAFYRAWQEANDHNVYSPWKAHFFSCFDDPTNRIEVSGPVELTNEEKKMQAEYGVDTAQVLWYRNKRAEMMDKTKMPQEHPRAPEEAFLSSGMHPFDLQKLSLKKRAAKEMPPNDVGYLEDDGQKVKFIPNKEGFLRVWKMPRQGRQYLVSADVAQGVSGGDWSVAQVFDRSTWEQVAVWRCRQDPGAWGRTLVLLARFFNYAVIAPENNSIGAATIEAIKAAEYPHLMTTKELWGEKEAVKEGFPTNEKTRSLFITALRNCIDDDTVYWNDPVTLGEMETFIQNKDTGKFEAQEGCWDDCVTSAGIGVYSLRFLTVDETYREDGRTPNQNRLWKPPVMPRGRAGY